MHFANGQLQPLMGRNMILRRLDLPPDNAMLLSTRSRLELALSLVEDRVGTATWLAGSAFTTADIMTVFTLTTMRSFYPLDLAPYPNIRGWLARVDTRAAYRRAMEKGDPGMDPMLS